jgi:hypothetical protein
MRSLSGQSHRVAEGCEVAIFCTGRRLKLAALTNIQHGCHDRYRNSREAYQHKKREANNIEEVHVYD